MAAACASAAPPEVEAILSAPDAGSLRNTHSILASEPHMTGTPGDTRTIKRLAVLFESYGLDVETHEFLAYLAIPVDGSLAIVTPLAKTLPVHETAVAIDPMTAHPDLVTLGWNAYSGSGDVTARVVYANYGTEEDFERLAELGVSCKGAIVLARYGRNFRGYKAKYAEAAGAAGLVIYTDPDDNGYNKGAMYPEGGYANPRQIQRGSIKALPYPGDPLTPFVPATEDAERLDPDSLGLPTIPVQPVGWAAVEPILAQMTGPEAPENWQGGLAPTYRLTGGDELTVRLMVRQKRELIRTANVIATMRGETHPEQMVIIGSHHDAWGIGAGDPLAGTIVTLETARALSALAEETGWRPARSLVFACWGAEEFGIIGSSEWCEANAPSLLQNAVAYINLDAAAMGPRFRASASPSLQPLLRELARIVPDTEGGPIRHEEAEPLSIGRLGGGSDHVGFLSHLCIPSINLGAGGSRGSAYHSNYDTLAWYRKVVGEGYRSAAMLTRMTAMLAVRLADDPLVALDPTGLAPDAAGAVDALRERAAALGFEVDLSALEAAIEDHRAHARIAMERARAAAGAGELTTKDLDRINALLRALDRAWLASDGLPGRPWHRNLYAAPDETSGYAAWAFPGIRRAIEDGDGAAFRAAEGRCIDALGVMTQILEAIEVIAAASSTRG